MILSRAVRRAATTAALATLTLGFGLAASPAYADAGTPGTTLYADLNDASGGQLDTVPPPHTATFSGRYSPEFGEWNHATTCAHFGISTGTRNCQVFFRTPNLADACSVGPFATYGYFAAVLGQAPVEVPLYWVGGGAMEGRIEQLGGGTTETAMVHLMRVQLAGACTEETLASLDGAELGTSRVGALLAATRDFSGWVDAIDPGSERA